MSLTDPERSYHRHGFSPALSTPFHKYGDVSRGATRGGMTGSSSTKGMHHAKEKPIRNPTYQAGASRIDGAVPGVYVAVS